MKEIKIDDSNVEEFVKQKIEEISLTVGDNIAINALSGGVDSSTVTLLGYRALGDKLKTYFIDSGLMRQDEPKRIVSIFSELDIPVDIVHAGDLFLKRLKGIKDPEEKREAISQTFYRDVFGEIVKKNDARYLLQGTNYTDVEETVAGIKRQHNILEQIGISSEDAYGYKVIEPLIQLRKPSIRRVAKYLGLPEEIYNRMPFPGPGLAARIIGEVTREKIDIVRRATKIVEDELAYLNAFQSLAILHEDKVTGIRNNKREYGYQIEIRCWDSEDARLGNPTRLSYDMLEALADRITTEIQDVVSVTYNITKKPPSTIEAV
ncbi:MAG: ExsB family transcriptional regulator [Candidatus Aenigmatarchaeota archaeon]